MQSCTINHKITPSREHHVKSLQQFTATSVCPSSTSLTTALTIYNYVHNTHDNSNYSAIKACVVQSVSQSVTNAVTTQERQHVTIHIPTIRWRQAVLLRRLSMLQILRVKALNVLNGFLLWYGWWWWYGHSTQHNQSYSTHTQTANTVMHRHML